MFSWGKLSLLVIRDAETFGEPPKQTTHAEGGERRKTRVLKRSGGVKGRGGDLRRALQPMRVQTRENMLVLWSGVDSVKVKMEQAELRVKISSLALFLNLLSLAIRVSFSFFLTPSLLSFLFCSPFSSITTSFCLSFLSQAGLAVSPSWKCTMCLN